MSEAIVLPATPRERWLAERRSMIGASDCAVILGIADKSAPWYRSPFDLWREKTGLIEPAPRDQAVEEYAYWGLAMEPLLIAEYGKRTGRKIERAGDGYEIVRHPDYPWLGATVDTMATHEEHGRGPVQIKTAGYSQRSKWLPDRIPLDYIAQNQIEMAVTGSTWGGFSVLIGGNTYVTREQRWDGEFFAAAIPILTRFARAIETRTPPED